MSENILFIAVIILVCLVLRKAFGSLGMPMLLAFILLGMIFGSDGIFKINFDNYAIAEQICSIALIFIMFYGGFGTSWNTAKPVAIKAIAISGLGTVLTALFTGIFCYLILKISFLESMLIGSVISSTDAASVFSILRSKRINLKYHTAPLLEVESGSNDPFSYMLTIAVLSAMTGKASGQQFIFMIFAQLVFGIVIGVGTAFAATYVLGKMKKPKDGVDTIFVFSVALISYAAASLIGGNGYLSTYIAGIILGNRPLGNKKALVHFFDGVTGLMQMLIFFLLGLLSFPSKLPEIAGTAFAIALFLTFIARPLSVFAILTPFRCPLKQQLLISWAGLRGAASIVFAIMATVHPAYMKYDVFHIVFFIVLFSISLQGSLIPLISKKLQMIDNNSNIMKTFSDYSEEEPVEFVQLSITPCHVWAGCAIKEIALLPELLLVLVLRGQERIAPKGDTILLPGDVLILSALSVRSEITCSLTEIMVGKDSEWFDKTLEEVELEDEKLVMLIKRKNRVILPHGKTKIRENDVLVLSQT